MHNKKINNKGEYIPFHGWTVVANVHDSFKMIENYIKNSPELSKCFGALPSESYHVTIYNIWSQGCSKRDLPNMEGWLHSLYYHLSKQEWQDVQLEFEDIYCYGTLGICFKETESMSNLDNARLEMIEKSGINDNMGIYHMTLGYMYQEPDNEEELHKEIRMLKILLQDQMFKLDKPRVCQFNDMTCFTPI